MTTAFERNSKRLHAERVLAHLSLMTPEQVQSYSDCEADVGFACPECLGSGDAWFIDKYGDEQCDTLGCPRCGGTGELPHSELSVNDVASASRNAAIFLGGK